MEQIKYTLAVLGIFKNESMVIKEWVDHYIWQGVEHFYLIDNGSTDNYIEILQPYIDEGRITLYILPEPHKQVEHYNTVFYDVKGEMEWLIVCDIDEYWYGINTQLSTYLVNLAPEINLVRSRWFNFGSDGHDKQPASIRESFILGNNDFTKLGSGNYSKYIIRAQFAKKVDVHLCFHETDPRESFKINGEWAYYNTDLVGWNGIQVSNQDVGLNHYQIMSREYYEKVKMTRGDVFGNYWTNLRTWEYFNDRDFREKENNTLANLVKNGYKK